MQRSVCIVAAALALYGASCFVMPCMMGAAPEAGRQAVREQALVAAPEAASASAGSWSPLALGAALGLLVAVATGRPALAADLENGESVFGANCAACHAGGNNSVVPEKKIKKEALVTYGKYDVAAIIKQVTYGNGSMPAFGERLGPDDIEDVANYVFGQADKW
uniref:Cytochrome c-553 n=1 Tax=Kryptoperidinium triquetrum TaxID=66468 RepID=Q5EGD1_KRYTR|nr:chloroplast cytochrome c6 [Heterocapsa triquetra]